MGIFRSCGLAGRVVSLRTGIAVKHVISQLPASAAMSATTVMLPCHDELDPSAVISPVKLFLL